MVRVFFLLTFAAIFLVSTLTFVSAQNSSRICPPGAEADEAEFEICKIEKEIQVLSIEVDRLREQEIIAPDGWSFIFDPAIVGAILGALAVAAGGGISLLFTFSQRIRQKRHLFRESLVERERRNLEILAQLGRDSHQQRITAAATIFHRIENRWAKNNFVLGLNAQQRKTIVGAEALEEALFVKVLLSVLRIVRANDEENERRLIRMEQGCSDEFMSEALNSITEENLDFELQKFIADELALAVGARRVEFDVNDVNDWRDVNNQSKQSRLKHFKGHHLDWQRTSLRKVWWKGIDARAVDFYQADMREAGLRAGHFQDAVFFETNLDDAVLQAANCTKANFSGATLRGARLTSSDFTGANLSGADLSGANLNGAVLTGATLESVKLDGAIYDDNTESPWPDFDFDAYGMVRA